MPDMTLSRFGRGICPACDRSIALTKTGVVRNHGAKDKSWPPSNCAGSRQEPKED